MPFGQSKEGKDRWSNIHIKCNLPINEREELTKELKKAIQPFKITNEHQSELYFCYYKPYTYTPAYQIEIKKGIAKNEEKLQKLLRSIKKQIISPEIREPYPQYLADIIAKNISFGMKAIDQAICNNPILKDEKYFDMIFPYRTK